MKRIFTISAGIIGVLVWLGFVFPALAQMRTTGSLPNLGVALLLLGIVLTLGGASAALYGLSKRGSSGNI